MLHTKTVNGLTLDILKKLMMDQALNHFVLVGGTELALQIGHRISIDLDLVSTDDFDQESLNEYLQDKYEFTSDFIDRNTLKGFIDGISLDFIAHKYACVDKISETDEIRIASLKDIAAMKLNAIIHNGTRLKDFIDIAFLGEYLTFNQMAIAYEEKYRSNSVMAAKALLYHEDIDYSVNINLLSFVFDFNWMKESLETLVMNPDQSHNIHPGSNIR